MLPNKFWLIYTIAPSMSFYPDFISILSKSDPDFIEILSKFYPHKRVKSGSKDMDGSKK